jgi:hypothetical protein
VTKSSADFQFGDTEKLHLFLEPCQDASHFPYASIGKKVVDVAEFGAQRF